MEPADVAFRSLHVVDDPIEVRRRDLERLILDRAVDPDEAHDLYVACRAVGGGAELA
jgi:hypothetical protein